MNSDFSDLLRLMDQFQVRFLVVGGYAVIRHTEPRFTKDLDLWIEATAENADRCFRALPPSVLRWLDSRLWTSRSKATSTKWECRRFESIF